MSAWSIGLRRDGYRNWGGTGRDCQLPIEIIPVRYSSVRPHYFAVYFEWSCKKTKKKILRWKVCNADKFTKESKKNKCHKTTMPIGPWFCPAKWGNGEWVVQEEKQVLGQHLGKWTKGTEKDRGRERGREGLTSTTCCPSFSVCVLRPNQSLALDHPAMGHPALGHPVLDHPLPPMPSLASLHVHPRPGFSYF